MTQEVRDRLEWVGVDWVKAGQSEKEHGEKRSLTVLDYGCGPGIMSLVMTSRVSRPTSARVNQAQALAPYATEFRGIDVSENMIKEYNNRARARGFSEAQMSATCGDLLAPDGPSESIGGPEFYDFDLAVVDLAFHHFQDPALAAKRLVERLKPGKGVLLIVDLVSHGPGTHHHGHHASKGVAHHGFAKQAIEQMLKEAGCVDLEYTVVEKPFVLGKDDPSMERQVFMIRGRREH